MSPGTARALGVFFVLIGITALIFGVKSYKSAKYLATEGLTSSGTVTKIESRIEHKTDSDGFSYSVTEYRPIMEYVVEDTPHSFTKAGWSESQKYTVNERVELIYDPTDPADARINTTGGIYGTSIALAIIGLIFTIIGIVMVIGARKKEEEPPVSDDPGASTDESQAPPQIMN